jgi:hypothetical protein
MAKQGDERAPQERDTPSCEECERRRLAFEKRAYQWLETITWTDDELRKILAFLDYHRSRSERRAFIETLRRRLWWILTNMK